MKVQSWEDEAYCRGIGVEIFYPQGHGPAFTAEVEQVKALCRNRCPITEQCLALALEREGDADRYSRGGIWGGLTGAERAELRTAAAA